MFRSSALLVMGLLVACGGSTPDSEHAEEPVEVVAELSGTFPQDIVVGPGAGRPALYLDANSPAVGYISPGVTVRVMGPAENNRYPIRVQGPLKIRGHLAASRIGSYVQVRGRVRGAPCYVGPSDIVGLRDLDEEGNQRIVLEPPLGNGLTLGPFEGVYPPDRLGSAPPAEGGEGPEAGTAVLVPADQEVPIYERPGGAVVATIPAHDPPVAITLVRDRGEWKGVRVGLGPYVIGYVNVELTPTETVASTEGAANEIPARLREEEDRPLYRVLDGARVQFEGRTFVIFDGEGYAREMNRVSGDHLVDVFTAANDDIAVRGMVHERYLELISGGPAASEPAASEDDFEDDFGE